VQKQIPHTYELYRYALDCLSDRICQQPHIQISPNLLYTLPTTVVRSSSDSSAIRYVLPVLRMTSFSRNEANGSDRRRVFRPVCQVAAPRAKSAVSDCILLLARLMGQYCFARWHMSSVVFFCNAAGGRAGRVGGRVTDTARRASTVTSR